MLYLKNLINLIDATLTSTPSIDKFHSIATHPNKVLQGGIYLAKSKNIDDINTALLRGAYAIVYDIALDIKEHRDSAWLFVENIVTAELKLLRFFLLQQNHTVYTTNAYTIEYIKQLNNHCDIVVLNEATNKALTTLWRLNLPKILVIQECPTMRMLFPTAQNIAHPAQSTPYKNHSALETLLFIDTNYVRQKLPAVMIEYFMQAWRFLQEFGHTPVDKLFFIPSFEAVSIDKYLHAVEFGKGVKTLICMHDTTKLESFLVTIHTITPWIEVAIFLPINHAFSFENIYTYTDKYELEHMLEQSTAHYCIVPFLQKMSILKSELKQPTLFDTP